MGDSQPFHELPAPVWDLVSPGEIRRRGEARARRRRAGASLGGLVLTTLVAAPLVLGLDRTPPEDVVSGSSPDPSSSATGDAWLQSVPAGFVLDAGLESAASHERDITRVTICGDSALTAGPVAGASDVLIAHGSATAGSRELRVLLLYPDADAAGDALRAVRDVASSCLATGDDSETMMALRIGAQPAEWAYLFPDGDGLGPRSGTGSLLTGRVGNSVLVAQWSGGSSAEPSSDDRLGPHVRRVLEDMCVFERQPC